MIKGGAETIMNLGRMIEETANKYPGNMAVIHEKCRMTFAELNGAANALAVVPPACAAVEVGQQRGGREG